jgi:hypothetical protein
MFLTKNILACTAFGVITPSGTIISKNRDYFYSQQNFELMEPISQFKNWYGNPYHHANKFYALIAKNDVKFGVNQKGLVGIEEDPPFPKNASEHRRYKQPYVGYSEGMILYGILQNFATVDEIVPYINQIFSSAAPNFYQIADGDSILNVEVAYGTSDEDPQRKYQYKILHNTNETFSHTNHYLCKAFSDLNSLASNPDVLRGSKHRLERINQYIFFAQGDFTNAFHWFLDTYSRIGNSKENKYCFNTSLFRSYIRDLQDLDRNTSSDKVYGTVGSFMVKHFNNEVIVYVRLLNKIHTLKNGDQEISYDELMMPLDELFKGAKLNYTTSSFIRKAPIEGICE